MLRFPPPPPIFFHTKTEQSDTHRLSEVKLWLNNHLVGCEATLHETHLRSFLALLQNEPNHTKPFEDSAPDDGCLAKRTVPRWVYLSKDE